MHHETGFKKASRAEIKPPIQRVAGQLNFPFWPTNWDISAANL